MKGSNKFFYVLYFFIHDFTYFLEKQFTLFMCRIVTFCDAAHQKQFTLFMCRIVTFCDAAHQKQFTLFMCRIVTFCDAAHQKQFTLFMCRITKYYNFFFHIIVKRETDQGIFAYHWRYPITQLLHLYLKKKKKKKMLKSSWKPLKSSWKPPSSFLFLCATSKNATSACFGTKFYRLKQLRAHGPLDHISWASRLDSTGFGGNIHRNTGLLLNLKHSRLSLLPFFFPLFSISYCGQVRINLLSQSNFDSFQPFWEGMSTFSLLVWSGLIFCVKITLEIPFIF